MNAFHRGIRNIYRNKARTFTLIVILALSLGLFVGMFQATSVISNQTKQLTSVLENTVELRNAGATGMGAGVELMPESDIEKIQGIPDIMGIDKQLIVRNVFSQYFPTISISIGQEPGKQLRVATHGEPAAVSLIEGRNFTPEDKGKNIAVVGAGFAQNRGLTIGSTYTEGIERARAGAAEDITPNPTEIEVVGIFSSNFAFGDNQVFLPFETIQRIYGLENLFSVGWITVDETKNVSGIEKTLNDIFAGKRDILTGQQKVEFVANSFDRILAIGNIGLALSLLVGGLVVLFTMILTANERIKEVGILKAIGASNGELAKQFIAETASLVLIGGLLGLIVFLTIGPTLVGVLLGLDQEQESVAVEMGLAPVTALVDVSYQATLPTVFMVLGIILLLAVVGSFYPLWRAVKMKPAQALRYE